MQVLFGYSAGLCKCWNGFQAFNVIFFSHNSSSTAYFVSPNLCVYVVIKSIFACPIQTYLVSGWHSQAAVCWISKTYSTPWKKAFGSLINKFLVFRTSNHSFVINIDRNRNRGPPIHGALVSSDILWWKTCGCWGKVIEDLIAQIHALNVFHRDICADRN